MARVWFSGFELGTANEWITLNSGSPSIQTSTVRTGTYSFRVVSLASGTVKGVGQAFVGSNNNGPYWSRFYFNLATAPSADNQIFNLRNQAGTRIVYLILNSSGALELWDEDGQVGSDSSALSTGTWYRIEVKIDATGGASADTVEARIDGTNFASATNRDLSTGVRDIIIGGNLNSEAQTTGEWFFDDIAVNDSAGSFQNSYPGIGSILHLRPSAAGDNAAWTRGGTDSGANWSQCDEVPPNSVTDYVQSNTADQIDDYNIDATPAAIGSSDTINVVAVGVQCRVDDATGGDPSFVVRVKASASGTVEEGTTITRNSNVWVYNDNARYTLTIYDLPGASTTAWTKSDLDSAQIGVRESASDTHNAQVSALWMIVDFTPSAGTQYNQSVSGGITPSGGLTKITDKILSGSITPSGVLTKLTDKILSGGLTPSGAVTSVRIYLKELAGSLTPTGALFKDVSKVLSGALSPAGSLFKDTLKILAGSLTPSGTVSSVRTFLKELSGSITPSGLIIKDVSKILSGNLAPSGTVVKNISKFFSGVITPIGGIIRTIGKFLSGSLAPSGELTAQEQGTFTSAGSQIFVRFRDKRAFSSMRDKRAKIEHRDKRAYSE